MTEQTNVNQSQSELKESTTEVTGMGFLMDLNEKTTSSYVRTGVVNGVVMPVAIGIQNVDEELGNYSQLLAFANIAALSMHLYGLSMLEQEFKEKGVLELLSESQREVLNIAFSANDYLKNAGVVTSDVPFASEAK